MTSQSGVVRAARKRSIDRRRSSAQTTPGPRPCRRRDGDGRQLRRSRCSAARRNVVSPLSGRSRHDASARGSGPPKMTGALRSTTVRPRPGRSVLGCAALGSVVLTAPPRGQPEDRPISGGAAMKSTISDWTTRTMSTGMFCEACIAKPPALKAPKSSPAARMPIGSGPAEQGDGDGVEADPGVEVDGDAARDRAEHLVGPGETDQGAGDQHHDDVGAADVDARARARVGVLADRADPEAEGGAVEEPPDEGRRRPGRGRSRGAGCTGRRAAWAASPTASSAATWGWRSPGPGAGSAGRARRRPGRRRRS